MTARRLLLGLLLLVAGAALTLAALWIWAGSGQSLQWTWNQLAPAHGLQAQALQGSLREGLRAQRLRWVLEDWEVEAEDVAIAWRPQDLPTLRDRGLLHVPLARIGTLRLTPRKRGGAAAPGAGPAPTRLTLPLNLQVDEARLGRFEVAGGWALRDVVAHYTYDGQQHQVQLRQARVAHESLGTLDLQGQVRLGAQAPLPLDLKLQGRWAMQAAAPPASPQALGLDIRASGPLALLDLHLLLRAPPVAGGSAGATPPGSAGAPQAEVRARVAPWSQPRWQSIDGRLSALDLAAWWPKAPRTRLSGRFSLAPPASAPGPGPDAPTPPGAGGKPASLQLDLDNAIPGPWSEGRLPLARLEGQADLDANLLRALRLQMDVNRSTRWQLQLQAPVRWRREADGRLTLGPGALLFDGLPVRLAWDGLQWGRGEWAAQAHLSGLPLAWAVQGLGILPAGWRLRGNLEADLRVSGTGVQARWDGALRADELALRSVVDGIDLHSGSLRARLVGRDLFIDDLQLLGLDTPGTPGSGGRLQARAQGRWLPAGGWSLAIDANLAQLRASLRPDRLVTVSGQARAELASRAPLRLHADLRVDQARITLPDRASPRLGVDVVVRGRPADAPEATVPVQLQARVDLGPDFQVRGKGLEAQARGRLNASGGVTLGTLRLDGQVDLAGGRYQAFGQRLRLERALLRFTGAPLNPALDLLALRPTSPSETQQVGVQVSGQALSPRVRLWSDPALPEAQALSWLALGQGSAAGGVETALLEDLAVTLLSRRAGLGGGTLAQRLGLDELGVRQGSASGVGGGAGGGQSGTQAGASGGGGAQASGSALQGATLAVGKRLARDLYAVYERGLSGVLGTLRVFYDINRRLQLRLEAGDSTGADLVYTVRIE